MEQKKERKRIFKLVIFAIVVLIFLAAIVFFIHKSGLDDVIGKYFPTKFSLRQAEDEISEIKEDEISENEFYATSHKPETEKKEEIIPIPKETAEKQPMTEEPVALKDVYTEEKEAISLKVYYPKAKEYLWEKYDISSKEWIQLNETEHRKDELYRLVSVCKIPITKEIPIMVRCTTITDAETYTDTANIHILEKEIDSISIEQVEMDWGKYVSCMDIPVDVRYEDGSEEKISGLYGMYFLDEEVNQDVSKTVSGNLTETTTTITTTTENEYSIIDKEEKEIAVRYRKDEQNYIDGKVTIKGIDKEPPKISAAECSGYEISNMDIPVTVRIAIEAEDNVTHYPLLEYAFLPEGQEIQEEDWKKNPDFETVISVNGNWVAYCRDQSGNIASKVQELVVVDQKAPEMAVRLKNTEWCVNTYILVEAEDTLPMKYYFSCPEKGIESGWIEENRYLVEDNGT